MYTLAVKRNFVAQHFLIGGDLGAGKPMALAPLPA